MGKNINRMIKTLAAFILLLHCREIIAQEKPLTVSVQSPDKRIVVSIFQNGNAVSSYQGKICYIVINNGSLVTDTSVLGFSTTNAGGFYEGLQPLSVTASKLISEKYKLVSGKSLNQSYTAVERIITLQNNRGNKFSIRFRVFNDGIAFRYEIARQKNLPDSAVVDKEFTSFNIPTESKVWIQPYDKPTKWTPAHEDYASNATAPGASPNPEGWYFPALINHKNNWLLISEAALNKNYFASHLDYDNGQQAYIIRKPEASDGEGFGNNKAVMQLPVHTPWRTIIVSENLQGILASQIIHHLNPPSIVKDVSWIKPGIASWSWWSSNDSPKDFATLKKYVDFSAAMHWPYSLVDANWNTMKNGSIEELAAYAKTKNVGLWLWYNSGGPHNVVTEQPRDALFDAVTRKKTFAWLKQIGIKGIKVDFFQSDKQVIVQEYTGILQDAAAYQLQLNFHGCTLPRGWQRTYPHLLSMEAICGGESYLFKKDFPENAPVQNTILPLSRNAVGPADYTPVIFSKTKFPHLTTSVHELALSVLYETGILHPADSAGAYTSQPQAVQQYLQSVPTAWDEVQYISGFPGKELVLARRKKDTWYIAGVNGEDVGKDLLVSSFITKGKCKLNYFFEDDKEQDGVIKNNVTKRIGDKITVKPYGAFLIVLKK
jgi:alpha-glucosidase